MTSHPRSTFTARPARGFTLIEILIAIAIVGIITAIAFPTYQGSIRKGRRAEAVNAIAALQQVQERWRSNHESYGNLNSPADANTLPNIATTTANGYYTIAVSGPSSTGYTVTATSAGSQAADTRCALMGVRMAQGNLRYGSATSSIDWSATNADAGGCWAK